MNITDNIPIITISTPPVAKNKSLRTNNLCVICGLYNHYSHHFLDLSEYHLVLQDIQDKSHESEITISMDIHPVISSSNTRTIYMISSFIDPSVSITMDDTSNLSSHCFNNDDENLEALLSPKYPWDAIHHCSFFIPRKPSSTSDQY